MRRIIVVLAMAAVMVALIATPGTPASAQSPCPPSGPSDGPATILVADEPVGAGFVCLDEEAQEFFCPPEFELQLFPVLPGEFAGPDFIAECVELAPSNDSGGASGEQQAEAGDIDQSTSAS